MTSPRWAAFTDGVLAAVNADSALGAGDVLVIDGPTAIASDAYKLLVIGGSFGDEANDAGSFDADWRTDGGSSASVDETLRLNCAARYRTGDADVAAARTAAFAILADVDRVIRSNVSLGVTGLLWCHITTGSAQQELMGGTSVTVPFTITARAII